MEEYINIEEYLATDNSNKYTKCTGCPWWGIGILIVSIAILACSLRLVGGDTVKMLLLTLGILGIIVGAALIIACCTGRSYRLKATGQRLKAIKIYIDASDRQKCKDAIVENNPKKLAGVATTASSCTLLQIVCTDDRRYALVQLEEYVPHSFIPVTPVAEMVGEDTANMIVWLKQ